MARAHYVTYLLDVEGRPIPGMSVALYNTGTTTPIAAVIHDADVGGSVLSNPFTASANGRLEFFLDSPQRVDAVVSKIGYADQRITCDVIVLTASTLVLQDEGVSIAQRSKINFVGSSVNATDAGVGPDRIDVTVIHDAAGVHTALQPPGVHTHVGSATGGTLPHSTLTAIGADDHHAKSHTHVDAVNGGTVAHSALTGIAANDHHTQNHAMAQHTDGPYALDPHNPAHHSVVGCKITKSSNQVVANGANAAIITFDTEVFDSDNLHSTGANLGRITCPAGFAGKWLINGQISPTGPGIFSNVILRKNGAQTVARINIGTGGLAFRFTEYVVMADGDYIELCVDNSGGPNTLDGTQALDNTLSAEFRGI